MTTLLPFWLYPMEVVWGCGTEIIRKSRQLVRKSTGVREPVYGIGNLGVRRNAISPKSTEFPPKYGMSVPKFPNF